MVTRQEAKEKFHNNLSRAKVNKNCQLKRCWVWPDTVTNFVKEHYVKGYTLNCPAGLSLLGDVRLDIEPQQEGVLPADMNKLPYPDNTFDTVISDPPWKMSFFKRQRPFFEAVRVCKVGGALYTTATGDQPRNTSNFWNVLSGQTPPGLG